MFSWLTKKKTIYVTDTFERKHQGKKDGRLYDIVFSDKDTEIYINKLLRDIIKEVPEFHPYNDVFGKIDPNGPLGDFKSEPLGVAVFHIETLGNLYTFYSESVWQVFHSFNFLGFLKKNGYRIVYHQMKPPKPILGVWEVYNTYLRGTISRETFLETYYTLSGIDITSEMKAFIDRTKFTPEQLKSMERIRKELELFNSLQIGKKDPGACRMLEISKEILTRGK